MLAFDSMYKKELINQYDAKMMEEAIKNVSNMSEADIRSENEKNQDEILKNDEIDKLVKKHDKAQLLDKEFKMVSHVTATAITMITNPPPPPHTHTLPVTVLYYFFC